MTDAVKHVKSSAVSTEPALETVPPLTPLPAPPSHALKNKHKVEWKKVTQQSTQKDAKMLTHSSYL